MAGNETSHDGQRVGKHARRQFTAAHAGDGGELPKDRGSMQSVDRGAVGGDSYRAMTGRHMKKINMPQEQLSDEPGGAEPQKSIRARERTQQQESAGEERKRADQEQRTDWQPRRAQRQECTDQQHAAQQEVHAERHQYAGQQNRANQPQRAREGQYVQHQHRAEAKASPTKEADADPAAGVSAVPQPPAQDLSSDAGLSRGKRSRNGRPRGKRGGLALSIVGTILLVVGICLFSYPMVDSYRAQQEAYETIESSIQSDTDDAPAGTTSDGKRAKEGDPAYEYLAAYNEQVRNGTGEAVNDPWGIGSNNSELSSIGLANDIVGSITIDRLNETIPLYLGASRAHLAYGACVIAGTSMPLGGVGNNCAIAAHRGAWHGLTMFRDIEDIQLGDLVVINTPWDTLTYRAAEIQVVSPTDTDSVKPQEGRDLVTLLTCHPYGHNYQRYLVICERVEGDDAAATTTSTPTTTSKNIFDYVNQATLPSASQDLAVERWVRAIGLLAAMAIAIGLVVYWLRRLVGWLRHKSNGRDADSQ